MLAIDTSRGLLAELEAAKTGDQVKTVLADLRTFPSLVESASVSVVVCMGDTLTHLDERVDVRKLYRDVYDALVPDGRFAITFRDLSQELVGLDRFLLV